MKVYRFITGPDDNAFCHRITAALNKGWELSGSPSLTFNSQTGQVIAKDVPGKDYDPEMKLGEQ